MRSEHRVCRALVLASCLAVTAPAAQETPGAAPSVEDFFRSAAYAGTAFSPNGRSVAVIGTVNGERALKIVDLESKKVTQIKPSYGGDVAWVAWQTDDRLIFGIGERQRAAAEYSFSSVAGVVAVNRDGSDERDYGSLRVLRVIPGTTTLLVGGSDVFRIDTEKSGQTRVSWPNPGHIVRWVMDFDNVPRAAVQADVDRDRSAWYVRKSAGEPWVEVEHANFGRLASQPMQFSPDGKVLYASARRNGADREAIYEYHVDDGTWTGPVVRHPERDIGVDDAVFVVDYRKRELLGLRYADDRSAAVWFDPEWARVQKSVDAALPGTVNDLYHAGDHWLVVAYSDRDPGKAWLLDARTMRMEELFSYRPWIDPKAMSPTRWVHYAARDGTNIPALLTVPASAKGKPVPLVVDVHGGPYAQATRWRYDAEVQFLASRGYAVLQPQFRGTAGFGWKLESSGFRRWGDAMQDDLEDGVKWAAAEGIADPARVCFYGESYGGYAAVWEAIRNPRLIKCAVSFGGMTSIDYLFDNAQTDMSRVAEYSTFMSDRIGDPKSERDRFKRVSPLDHADQVGVPLLLAYGAADRRVPLVHGSDFRSRLDKYHKPYEWVVYADEGHGLPRDADRFDYFHRVEQFLAKYLGSTATPAVAADTK